MPRIGPAISVRDSSSEDIFSLLIFKIYSQNTVILYIYYVYAEKKIRWKKKGAKLN